MFYEAVKFSQLRLLQLEARSPFLWAPFFCRCWNRRLTRVFRNGLLLEKSEVLYIPKWAKKFSNAIFLNFRRNVTEMERFGGRVNVLNKISSSILIKSGTWKFFDPGFLNLCSELLVKSFVRAQASWFSFGSWTCWCFEKTTRIGFSWRTRLFRWVRAERWFDCLFNCTPTSGSLMVVGHLQQSVVFLVVKNFHS